MATPGSIDTQKLVFWKWSIGKQLGPDQLYLNDYFRIIPIMRISNRYRTITVLIRIKIPNYRLNTSNE